MHDSSDYSFYTAIFECLTESQLKRYRVYQDLLKNDYQIEDILDAIKESKKNKSQNWSVFLLTVDDCYNKRRNY